MKKIILIATLLAVILGGAVITLAEPVYPDVQIDLWGANSIFYKVVNWFFGIVVVLAAIFIIYAGYTYVISGGDPGKIKNSLNAVIYSLIGVGIALLAKGLVYLLCTFFGVGQSCKFW